MNGSTPTIPSHARLTRDAGCDNDEVGALQRLLQAIDLGSKVARNHGPSVDVVQVRCDTRGMNEVVEGDLVKQVTLLGFLCQLTTTSSNLISTRTLHDSHFCIAGSVVCQSGPRHR